MEHEMNSIAGAQAAKVLGFTFFFFAIAVLILLGITRLITGDGVPLVTGSVGDIVAFPFWLSIGAYVCTRIFCAIYNRAATRWGGIKLQLTEIHSPMNPKWKPQ